MTDTIITLDTNAHPERANITVKPGERVAICRCWQSKTFPLCDGSHRAFNEENNCCLGPAVVVAEMED